MKQDNDVNINRNLGVRTMGEELWLWRKSMGLTQAQAAARLGLAWRGHGGREYVARAEYTGETGALGRAWQPLSAPGLPLLLKLARRRSGLGLMGTAKALNSNKVAIHRWESQGAENLIEFWARKDFTFA